MSLLCVNYLVLIYHALNKSMLKAVPWTCALTCPRHCSGTFLLLFHCKVSQNELKNLLAHATHAEFHGFLQLSMFHCYYTVLSYISASKKIAATLICMLIQDVML